MKYRSRITFIATILIFVSLACVVSGQTPEPERSEDAVATIVSATLSALESSTDIPPDILPTEAPPDVPEPTPLPAILRVAYVQSGDIWLWTESSAPMQLSHTGLVSNLTISDDGLVVAFTRELSYTEYELWAVNSDGSNERRLFSVGDFAALPRFEGAIATAPFQLDWVPGTHTLAFNTNPVFEGPGLINDNNLHLFNADTLVHTLLLPNGQGGMFYYSPDGSQIAIVTPENISLVNADGGNRREMIAFPNIYTYSEYAYYPEPIWLPDSSALRVAIPPQDPLGDASAPTALWQLPADGSPAALLRNVITVPFFVSPPTFSADGNQIAYLAQVGDPMSDRRDLHIAALDGSSDIVYQTGTIWFSGWSPDSIKFVYASGDPNVLQLGWAGSAPAALTDTASAMDVNWISADDILFVTGSYGDWELRRGVPGGASSLIVHLVEDFPTYDFDH